MIPSGIADTPPLAMVAAATSDLRHATPTPRLVWILLVLLLVWSLGIRLGLAQKGLHRGHHMDEKYAVHNLQSVLESGRLRPVNFYYTSLSYLPQALVLATTQGLVRWAGDPTYTVFEAGRLRPEGYLLCRSLQVFYGLTGLLMTFFLGQRLFSSWIGLAAAAILAASPAHIRLSAVFKPGILLALITLLAFFWSLEAVRSPTLRRYGKAGIGVGLAGATKLTGGPIAVPLALGALWRGRHDRRHLLGLALAGLAAVTVFVALNPQLELYMQSLRQNLRRYEDRSLRPALQHRSSGSYLDMLSLVARLFLEPGFHGPWIGAAALAGLAVLAGVALRQSRSHPAKALSLAMLVSFPLAQGLIYAALTPLIQPSNFLPLVPFTSLAAAWLLGAVWSWLCRRAERLGVSRTWTRWVTAAACLLLAGTLVHTAQSYAYSALVPTTWRRAMDFTTAQLRPLEGRLVIVEATAAQLSPRSAAEQGALRSVERLFDLAPEELDRADAELFATRRLDGPGGDFYARRLLTVPPGAVHRFDPELFQARGESVVVLLRPRHDSR